MKVARQVASIVLALSVFVALPALSVAVGFQFLGPWFVAREYAQPGFPPAERYQPAERLALSQETVRWLVAPNGAEGLRQMESSAGPVYNAREVGHLVDVMKLLGVIRGLAAAAGAICLVALGVALARPALRRPVACSAFWGSAALLAVLAVILLGALTSFDTFFVGFHEALFPPDTWVFDFSDSLIQFYPVQFWMDFFYQLGALFVVEALVVAGAALLYLRKAAGRRRGVRA
jgi:integral membrane protein (TIGR01906 family)